MAVEPSKRFSAKKLSTLGESLKGSETLQTILTEQRTELARRVAAGESY